MAVTGVVLAYKRQITEWADGDFRVATPAPAVPRLPMETVIANVLAQGRGKPVAVTLRAGPTPRHCPQPAYEVPRRRRSADRLN